MAFDIEWSKEFFKFSNKTAHHIKGAYPCARTNSAPYSSSFQVRLTLPQYGWFGIGTTDISPTTSIYKKSGWAICTDGRLYHEGQEIKEIINRFEAKNQELLFVWNQANSTIEVTVNSITYKYPPINAPPSLYFVVCINEGSVTIHEATPIPPIAPVLLPTVDLTTVPTSETYLQSLATSLINIPVLRDYAQLFHGLTSDQAQSLQNHKVTLTNFQQQLENSIKQQVNNSIRSTKNAITTISTQKQQELVLQQKALNTLQQTLTSSDVPSNIVEQSSAPLRGLLKATQQEIEDWKKVLEKLH